MNLWTSIWVSGGLQGLVPFLIQIFTFRLLAAGERSTGDDAVPK